MLKNCGRFLRVYSSFVLCCCSMFREKFVCVFFFREVSRGDFFLSFVVVGYVRRRLKGVEITVLSPLGERGVFVRSLGGNYLELVWVGGIHVCFGGNCLELV